ncbi:hypothetical protein B566_EDAN010466 [Ephemera danica]|nr:hypothetical protein B566_EDAN010466 [Ephemera danica]
MTLDSAAILGRRVECEGYRGTVRFVGEIEGTGCGTWLGVDWDDVSRGKHDGSHKEKRYFTTRYPTSGSFVRPHKVNLGRTCSTAITEQYEPLQQEKLETMQREAVFKANRAQVKVFEFVGFDEAWEKTSQHENLSTIDLRCQQISGGDSSLSQLCPNLVELDVRQNLLSSWEDVASITKHLPKLRTLNISQNRMTSESDIDTLLPAFVHIQHLIAGQMELDSNDLLLVAKLFPNLLSFQLVGNNITTLDSSLCHLLPKLQDFDLANNPLENWDEVFKLVRMNSLETLHLQNTGISEINFDSILDPFPSLKTLFISGNKINDWISVSYLERLTKLEELSFRNNPVLNLENFETNRQIVICRINHLKILDKIIITEVERRGASLDYLKKFGTLYLNCVNDPVKLEEFQKLHPCYQRLVDKYGAPEAAELVAGSTKLKNLLVNLSVSCPQTGSKMQKKVPRTMKIQKLRGMLQKQFCAGMGNRLTILYKSQEKPNIHYEFDNDLKDLAFYSIQEGDEIIVSW